MKTLDNRGCLPPTPLYRTLGALAELAPNETLDAYFDRRPIMLYPQLSELGCRWVEESLPEGKVRLLITRL